MRKRDKVKGCFLGVVVFALTACAEIVSRQDQALRDFIEIEQLKEERDIKINSRDRKEIINADFIIYKTKERDYLIEFRSSCRDMIENNVVPDKRWDTHTIRARFDTINGCTIANIYALKEGQAEELKQIGDNTETR